MFIGNREFKTGQKPYIMGILNVTPDSFSDGGNYTDIDKALKKAKQMIDDGADIIDVGGESSRPGHTKISEQEEIERTCFVIEAIKEHFNVPVSLDTCKSKVAQAGILAGADLINDIWGFKWDDKLAGLVADAGVCCCLMHNREKAMYNDLVNDVISDLEDSIELALSAGISKDKIIIDAGIGFAKSTKDNLIIMNNMDKLVGMGYPVLLGASRKTVIGDTLSLPVDEREEGTMAASVVGLIKGCTFFRVHDVKANYRALKMAQGIIRA